MYAGDKSRKDMLVGYGFRLPSAYDNRPLNFIEFLDRIGQSIFVSATPGKYEYEHTGAVVEQIIRPTGLVDPEIIIEPVDGQIDHLLGEIRGVIDRGFRALVITLTKKMSERLSEYFMDIDIKAEYLHSDVSTLERVEIIDNSEG